MFTQKLLLLGAISVHPCSPEKHFVMGTSISAVYKLLCSYQQQLSPYSVRHKHAVNVTCAEVGFIILFSFSCRQHAYINWGCMLVQLALIVWSEIMIPSDVIYHIYHSLYLSSLLCVFYLPFLVLRYTVKVFAFTSIAFTCCLIALHASHWDVL